MKVMSPWTPLALKNEGESVTVGVYGRTYRADTRSFLSSITSQGEELLSAPIRFVLCEDGEEYTTLDGWQCFPMAEHDEGYADVIGAAESRQFVLNTAVHTEFDGCMDITLTVVPRGRSVAQCFGLELMKPYGYRLDKLYMEIPLRREAAEHFQFYPKNPGTGVLESGGKIAEGMALSFKEQVFLTNDRAGLILFFESEESFVPRGNPRAIEILPDGDTLILRVRLFDAEPPLWRDQRSERIDMNPISFRFGLMATPVKPMPDNVFKERAVHIDCYKKILEDYRDFLSAPFGDTAEITFDRLTRLGVNTLYIHEKWNDLQNSTDLTAPTAERLRYIITEAHSRSIKVIPYFGYEMSTLAPAYLKMRDKVWRYDRDTCRGSWYRQPPQRNIRVCQKSEFSDYFCEGIDRLMSEYGFDGIYLDGTAYVSPCQNSAHGCGFTDRNGRRHSTYPVFDTRKTMKRLYEIVVEKHGGIINCHAGSAFNMPALSFATSLWDGEVFQTGFLKGEIDVLPDRYFRALYTGRNIGVPIYMLSYLNPPIWDFHMALSTALPFGVIPKVNDAGEPLEIISRIWQIYGDIDADHADFIPYYSDRDIGIRCSDPEVLVSAYRQGDRLLIILATTSRTASTTFTLTSPLPQLTDAMSGEPLSENGTVTLSLHGFDFKLIKAEMAK